MSDQKKQLARGLFDKLEANGFNATEFNHTTEEFASGRKNAYSSISATGREENMQKLNDSLTPEEKEVELEIDFGPQTGDQCPDLPVKLTSTDAEKILTFVAEDPKVYLLDFWATWCGPCQGPMAHNQKMLENNPDWENKAEIVCISLDDNAGAPNKRITENNWTKVTSYWAGIEGFGAEAPKKFNVNGIPKCVLVKNGKVLWSGHPSERKLEEDINGLIEGKDVFTANAPEPAEAAEENPLMSEEELSAKMEIAKAKVAEFLAAHPQARPPDLVAVSNLKIKKNSESQSVKVYMLGSFLEKHRSIGEAFISLVTEIFPNPVNRVRFEETITIVRGTHCNLCQKELSVECTQYMCVFCEPKHYHCEECHNAVREGKGSARLPHPHSLYKIHKDAADLDEIRFGPHKMRPDTIYEEEPESLVHRGVGCDNRNDANSNCPGAVSGIRYKCAHCVDYDFCQNCEGVWMAAPTESMISTAKKMGHLQSHVMIVMVFPH